MLPAKAPTTLLARAEAAEVGQGLARIALKAYRSLNKTPTARARTWLGEARACLGLDLAAQAERPP